LLTFSRRKVQTIIIKSMSFAHISFSFGTRGATFCHNSCAKTKKKQKENAAFVGRRPTPRELLKKLDQNFPPTNQKCGSEEGMQGPSSAGACPRVVR
jgi:hypothetical protein